MLVGLLLVWLLVIYLPFAMRSWRAFLALCAVYLLFGLGVQYGVATYTAAEVPYLLVGIGNFWIDAIVALLPFTVIARAMLLAAKSLGASGRRLLALNILGILVLPGYFVAKVAYEKWERRPPSAACTARPISMVLAGIEGVAGWNEAISLYLGPNIAQDARYLFSPAHQRSICRDTTEGTGHLTIAALSIRTDRVGPDRCSAPNVQPWEQAACAARADHPMRFLPPEVIIFDPAGLRLGDFGIPDVATNGDYPLGDDQRLISAASPGLGTVMAVCHVPPSPGRAFFCQMRRPINGSVSLYWELSAAPATLDDSILQAEAIARSACSSIFGQAVCDGSHPIPR